MRGLRIATRCADVEQFVATFHRMCGQRSIFVPTTATRPIGMETAFSLDLRDNTPALRGLAIVEREWKTADNQFGRPGIEFGIKKLTSASEAVFAKLQVARTAHAGVVSDSHAGDETDATHTPATMPVAGERTPGGDLVLPANPLADIPDASLAGFVECTLYEETGTFFPVEPVANEASEPVAAPPLLAPLVPKRAASPRVSDEAIGSCQSPSRRRIARRWLRRLRRSR